MNNGYITLEKVSKAISVAYTYKNKPIESKKVDELAYLVLSVFGYDDSVSDNALQYFDGYDYGTGITENPVRSLFRMLEDDTGILKESSEEIKLYNEKNWRIFYWHLDREKIDLYLDAVKKEEEQDAEKIYQRIFKEYANESENYCTAK